ncbi:GAF and ANTAR domain-containing protein [Spelaeicoccus albus]|uniref:Transcriptional regulator with GAF, ATPase, and Fis domain n=1 Tax=Spelaeicoccus albus TaxID=1280376 RepID=A0A7Z0D4M2_9MICO|nr:GAF and ANTAR domain-containing protein [Spelaeicoccus albus]NYI68716.1 transcriptional regulator with GAF, ATPase, and Fis domain [Spelaeicoccus albus]
MDNEREADGDLQRVGATEDTWDALSEIARALQQEDDPEQILVDIVDGAIQLVPGVDAGSISFVLNRKKSGSRAASGELPSQIDAVQNELNEGPCLRAVYDHPIVRVSDMRSETRWPTFARRAYELGVGSMIAFQLWVEDENLGALNLFARDPGAFDEETERIGLLYAAQAAVAYAETQKTAQLSQAIETRDLIGQAKGILMERYKMSAGQAFRVLVRSSSTSNKKLHVLAEELATTGQIAGVTDAGASGGI